MMETIIILENRQYASANKMVRRTYWVAQKGIIKQMCLLVMTQTRNRHLGRVTITVQRYACRLMDWDNFCAGFKPIGDALRHTKVIVDDNPEIVVKFIPEQYKVAHKPEERVIIRINDHP